MENSRPGQDVSCANAGRSNQNQRGTFLAWLCFAGVIFLVSLLNFHTLADTDIFWHLRTGEVILHNRRIPDKDIFSFTMSGQDWIDVQWLFQICIYFFYKLGGYAGMIILGALVSALTWMLVLLTAFSSKRYVSVIALCMVAALSASMRMNLRPETFSYLFLAFEIFVIHKCRSGKRFYAAALPLVLLLWVNTQGIWPIFLVVLAIFLFEEILFLPRLRLAKYLARPSASAPQSCAPALGLAFAFSLPLILANPRGWRGAVFPLKLLYDISSQSIIKRTISELQGPLVGGFPLIDRIFFMLLITLSAAFICTALARRRIFLSALLLWAVFLALSFSAIRNVPLFAMISASVVAGMFAEEPAEAKIFLRHPLLQNLAGIFLLGAMAATAVDVVTSRFFIQDGWYSRFGFGALETDYPIRASRFLEKALEDPGHAKPVKILGDFQDADYFMWSGWPGWKLYFDTRLDQVYPEPMYRKFMQASADPGAFAREDSKYDLDVVVLSSFFLRKDFIVSLFHNPGWALVYLDGFNVVFLKNKPEWAGVIQKYRIDFSRPLSSPLPAGLSGVWLSRERLYRGYMLLALGHPELAALELQSGLKIDPKRRT